MSLYVVATPIGNLEDITLRALRVLTEVDLVLCEDTRQTKKLLSHYEIGAACWSYHAHTSEAKTQKILEKLRDDRDLALVTDSGTPAISDPGTKLVGLAREEFGEALEVLSVPGPSAAAAGLSISGLPASDFVFLGFLPRKKGRKTLFKEIAESRRTVVMYESPHRITKTLRELAEVFGSERQVVIARELTKTFEEVLRGTASELVDRLEQDPKHQKGEFVVMVAGA